MHLSENYSKIIGYIKLKYTSKSIMYLLPARSFCICGIWGKFGRAAYVILLIFSFNYPRLYSQVPCITPIAGVITQPTCAAPVGSVTITAPLGTTFEYSKDGTNWVASPVFSGLSPNATYTISARDPANPTCITSYGFVINAIPAAPVVPQATLIQPTCGTPTGTIVLTDPLGGTYEYSKDGTTWQSLNTFSGLAAHATYTIRVRNTAGDLTCIASSNFIINAVPGVPTVPLATITQPTCITNTGTIVVTSPLGATLEYSLDGITWQGSTTFGGLTANSIYAIRVRNAATDPTCFSSANFLITAVPVPPSTPAATLTQPTCAVTTGTITVTSPTGSTFTYSRDGTTWQSSATFSGLAPNSTYTISVRTTSQPTCISTANFIINATPTSPSTPLATITQPTCSLVTGTIVVTAPLGAGLEYSKDGTTWQTSTTFSGLAANTTHTISARITANPTCISSAGFVINAVPGAPATPLATLTQPTCAINTGTITITSPTGTGLEYSKDGTNWQSSTIFSGLAPNTTALIRVRNTSTDQTCVSSASFAITAIAGAPAAPTATLTQPTCATPTGTIEILSPLGTTLQYSKDGTTWQSSTTFSGLAATSTYAIRVRNTSTDPSCFSSANFVISAIPNPPATPVATLTQPTCSVTTGTIVVTSPSGSTMEYSKDGTNWQTTTSFSGLSPNTTYTISARTTAQPTCVSTANFVINGIPLPPSAPVASITEPTCALVTGSITITSPTGSGIEYSKDGTTWQTSVTFSGFAANSTQTIRVRTTTNPTCISSATFTINGVPGAPAAPLATITEPTCTTSTGTIDVTSPLGTTFEYSKNGTSWQTTTTFSGLAANATYTISVRNTANPTCISTGTFAISAAPPLPPAPTGSIVSQPTCLVGTGSIAIFDLPATGNWTLVSTSGTIAVDSKGAGIVLNDLSPGSYSFKVTNSSGCTSPASAGFSITNSPAAPLSPLVGSLIQPTCSVSTGGLTISRLPATGNWTLTRTEDGSILTGTGTSVTLTDLASGNYSYSVTNAGGCVSSPSSNAIIKAQPDTPSTPLIGLITEPTCSKATGSVILSSLPSIGSWKLQRLPDGVITGSSGNSTTISGLVPGTYNYTVTNSLGCTSLTSADFVIDPQPVIPSAPVAGTITPPACATATGSIQLRGLPASGTWTVNPGAYTGKGDSTVIPDLAKGTYKYSVTSSAGCVSPVTANIIVPSGSPTTPVVGTITQPTCTMMGSAILSGLPPSGTWTITRNPGGTLTAGTGTTTTLTGLTPGTYSCIVTTEDGCPSAATTNIVISALPPLPSAPRAGTITQPTCDLSTGSVILTGLPSGTWKIDPGAIEGTGTTTTLSGLVAGTYTFTVTNSIGCTSLPSSNVLINIQPETPQPPVIDSISQPTCLKSTGTLNFSNLPAAGTWILTRTPGAITTSSSGTNFTISTLASGTYTYKVTNSVHCTSPPSAVAVINDQPPTPPSPVIGSMIQPSCTVQSGTITITVPTGSGISYSLDGTTYTKNTGIFDLLSPGAYTFTAKNEYECISKGTKATVNPLPVCPPTALNDSTSGQANSLLRGNVSENDIPGNSGGDTWSLVGVNGGALHGKVTFSSDGTFAYTPEVNFFGTDIFTYQICDRVTTANCPSARVKLILVKDENAPVFVPNSFSPNGDGINDYYQIGGIYNYENPVLEIYNRWGQLVFKKDHYGDIGYWGSEAEAWWNGRSNNKMTLGSQDVPAGTYYYILKLEVNTVKKGFIFLNK